MRRHATVFILGAYITASGFCSRVEAQIPPTASVDEKFCADPNGDGRVDIGDAVWTLTWLFQGTAPPWCVSVGSDLAATCADLPQPTGQVVGSGFMDLVNGAGVATEIVPALGMTVVAIDPFGRESRTEVGDDGTFTVSGLEEGRYTIRGIAEDGTWTEIDVDVAADKDTTINFAHLVASEEMFAGLAGVAIDTTGTPNPDIDGSGVIDLRDLTALREAAADLEDPTVLELAEEYFGRTVIRVPGEYEALVTAGGTVFTAGEFSGRSLDGGSIHGEISIEEEPNRLRFRVTSDQASIEIEELGTFEVTGREGGVTSILVDLDSGQVLEGSAATRVGDMDVDFEIGGGWVAGAPHGFGLYHLVGVTGQLGAFPIFMSKSDPPKKTVLCKDKVARCPPALGSQGFICTKENTPCSIGGRCGKCVTAKAPRTFHADCICECQ